MAIYTIGITEAGDAGVDLSWEKKIEMVDGAILITKNVSPEFRDAVISHCEKVVIHATVTGFGGSVLEPGVPKPVESLSKVMELVRAGFPQERVVIRVDPIIPTKKGLNTALETMEMFMEMGFTRYRISVIDMHPHVRERFTRAGLPLPYGKQMYANKEQFYDVDAMLLEARTFWENNGRRLGDLRIESCAEPWLTEAIACGCISARDLSLMNLDPYKSDSAGHQRQHCMCYSGKKELLGDRHPCRHDCLYCYWKK